MWTDFNGADRTAMMEAANGINDYRQIVLPSGQLLKPIDTVAYHTPFVTSLERWFAEDFPGKRVVISHHAPVINLNTQYDNSPLMQPCGCMVTRMSVMIRWRKIHGSSPTSGAILIVRAALNLRDSISLGLWWRFSYPQSPSETSAKRGVHAG
jgi:hypothetical protein